MVQRRQRERSLFEVLLPDGHKLWPDWLRKIDSVLEDEAVIEVVAKGLEARWPQSRRRGRLGTPVEIVLRMLILKHLFDWSYDDLEHEVRANLVYRAFTRIDAGDVPDAKTILKIARALGPAIIEQLHRQVIEVAKRAGVTHGRRFRIDTTVVETNVHYPTDSTLLRDGMRVLTRTMQRASAALGDPRGRVRNRLRSVTRRVLIIGYEARSPKTRDAMVKSYRKLMATTRAVLRDTATMVRRLGQRVGTARPQVQPMLRRAQHQLQAMRPLVQRVVDQTRARVLAGNTHVADKVLSVFEPHTETIRKGKIAKPNEFGKLVTIQESEHQIVTAYEVHTEGSNSGGESMLSICRVTLSVACASLIWAVPVSGQNVRSVLFAELVGAPEALSQLKPTDFEMIHAGVKQTVVRISPGDGPLRVALLVDTSDAAEPMLNHIRAALVVFADALPQPHEIALVAIGRNTRILEKSTTDRNRIKASAKRMFQDGGDLVLVDGIRETFQREMQGTVGWPVFLIITTDAVDFSGINDIRYNNLVNELQQKATTVHALVVNTAHRRNGSRVCAGHHATDKGQVRSDQLIDSIARPFESLRRSDPGRSKEHERLLPA